ncbi:hypothetical protein [Sphingomonas sp.]|uniref:hypothetical protein n=1 Tax=Sphingomonas sp. TaxID=28214 RepID=UPI002B9AA4AE|nr:hypothetical protein [Sphingomonas sp.]HWK35219.1 hypothetical protein [Sphingomonas sp.]
MARPLPPLWLAHPSRFAGLSRRRALWAGGALLLLLIASLIALKAPAPPADALAETPALAVYESVIAGLRAGGGYYQLTADSLRAGAYPLRPFFAFRLPAHSVVQAALPPTATLVLLGLLVLAVAMAWWHRLKPALPRPPARFAAMVLLGGGLATFLQSDLIAAHELWAGLLVALALALRTPGRWLAPAAIALMAMLVRESAAVFVVVMAAMALLEGRRREALGWTGALLLFAVAVATHAHAVAQVTGPLDPAAAGWAGMPGFGLFLQAAAATTALRFLPLAIAAPLIVLALFGWACWRDALALRALAVFCAYALVLGLLAGPGDVAQGLLVAPMILVGLAFAPDGLRDLASALLDRRRVRVQRVST